MTEMKATADVIADLQAAVAASRAARADAPTAGWVTPCQHGYYDCPSCDRIGGAPARGVTGDHTGCPVRYVAGEGSRCMAHDVPVGDDSQETPAEQMVDPDACESCLTSLAECCGECGECSCWCECDDEDDEEPTP